MSPVGLGLLSPYSLIGQSRWMTGSIERRGTWSAGQFSAAAQPPSRLSREAAADGSPVNNRGELEQW